MQNVEQLKIPIIEGINDYPLPPNYNDNGRGPNGAYLTEKFNSLIDNLVLYDSSESALSIVGVDSAGNFAYYGTNDIGVAGFYSIADASPVKSVASKTGIVSLVKADVGLGEVDNTSDINKPISTATQDALDLKADLVNGLIPSSQIPSIAITEYLGSVNSEVAMLALSGERGDWCIRTDIGSTFILVADGGDQLIDWLEISTPTDAVSSVNSQTGAVVLGAADVGAETSSQLDTRDTANRSRANHTGTQEISTISGLNDALSSKYELPAGGTISQYIRGDGTLETFPTLGTAASQDYGTSANNLIRLDSEGKLPAVDGSALTNITGGGHTVQDEGISLIKRTNLNFVGSTVSVTDNVAEDTTVVTISNTNGLGWTGGSYDSNTGIVTFTSDDGLGFATGDLRGTGLVDNILTLEHTTTPADPGANKTSVYAKSDGALYYKASGGSESIVGTGAPSNADAVTVYTTNFNNNLSSLDNTVQKALETLDDLVIELSSDVTWYVATDGDPNADGLTVNTAINPETAFKRIPTVVFNGFILTLKLAAGTYNSNYDSYYTYGLRIPEGGIVILSGETWTTDPTTIVNYLEASNSSGFFLIIENIKFTDSFVSFNSTNEVLIRNCCYEPMQPTWSCMFLADSCRVRLSGTIQFNSDFFALAQLARATKLDLENCVFKDAGTPKTFNTFIDLKTNSVTFIGAPTISGTFTGKKFNINKGGGYIAGNVSLLPGDTPGTYGKSIFYDDVTLATVATSGSYNDLSNLPTLGTASAVNTEGITGTTIITVTVDTGKFLFNGLELTNGLLLLPGRTYRFDLSDATNATHDLRFSITSDGTHGGGVEYTTGVTTTGTSGTDGIVTFIPPVDAPETLYPYCITHTSMGGTTVFKTQGGGEKTAAEITVDTTNFNSNLSGTDTTVQAALETLDDLVVGGGGHTIQDESTPLTQRTNLNFVGSAVTVTDDSGNDASVVSVNLPTTGSGLNLGTWDNSGSFTAGVRFDGSGDKVLLPKATTAERSATTLLEGELVYDTDEDKFYYGDGTTLGGVVVGGGTFSTIDIYRYSGGV